MNKTRLYLRKLVCAIALGFAWCGLSATSYVTEGTTLKITVPAGEENAVDPAQLAGVKANEIKAIEKLGAGTIVMTDDISAYAGGIFVKAGIWKIIDAKGLGDGTGSVSVDADAVLLAEVAAQNDLVLTRSVAGAGMLSIVGLGDGALAPTNTVRIAEGKTFARGLSVRGLILQVAGASELAANTMLALTNASARLSGASYDFSSVEASVGVDVMIPWRDMEGNVMDPERVHNAGLLEGHRFYLASKGETSDTAYADGGNGVVCPPVAVRPGAAEMYTDHLTTLRQRPAWDTAQDVKAYEISYTGYMWNRSSVNAKWTFCCYVLNQTAMWIDGKKVFLQNTNKNAPIVTVEVTPGPHAIKICSACNIGNGGTSSAATNINSTAFGLRYDPQGRGTDDVENYVKLEDPGDGSLLTWKLPDEDHPVFGPEAVSFAGGAGKAAKFVKSGTGTLVYDSALNADRVEVRSGTVALRNQCRAKAGLREDVTYFYTSKGEDANNAYSAAQNGKIGDVFSRIASDPELMGRGVEGVRKRPAWDTANDIRAYCLSYSGYIWNHEATNVNWTFIGYEYNDFGMRIDGTRIISKSGSNVRKTTVTVTPGPHLLVITQAHQINDGGCSSGPTNIEWYDDAGKKMAIGLCWWDRYGRDSDVKDCYEMMSDPGDGSLFTWGLPDEPEEHPETRESVGRLQPVFTDMAFASPIAASRACLDADGLGFTIRNLEGLPNIVNFTNLTVTGSWALDAADIVSGHTITGNVNFGESATLKVINFTALRDLPYDTPVTILKSTGDISNLEVQDPETLDRCKVIKKDDGSVVIERRRRGLLLTVY